MTTKDWNNIINPPPLYTATIKFPDGDQIEETTSGNTFTKAEELIQPGWIPKITVVALCPRNSTSRLGVVE